MNARARFAAAASARSARNPIVRGAACAFVLVAFLGIGASSALAAAPVVTIEAASEIGVTSALAKGEVNAEDHNTSYHFEWVTQEQFENEGNSFAAAEPNGQVAGFGEAFEGAGAVPVEAQLFNLTPGTTYHLRLVATNTESETVEDVAPTFETEPLTAPTFAADPATGVGYTVAHLAGEIDPEGGNSNPIGPEIFAIYYQLQYSPKGEGSWATAKEGLIEGAEATSSSGIEIFEDLAPGTLVPGREYEVRVHLAWLGGEQDSSSTEFQTLAATAPSTTTPVVESIGAEGAHLKAEVNPNAPEAAPTSADVEAAFRSEWHFECEPGCGQPSGEAVAADNAANTVEADASALQPNKNYRVWLVASNAGGATESASEEFKTQVAPPAVETGAALDGGSFEVRKLTGAVNPNNLPTTYWFEYGREDCSASACTSVPATQNAEAGSGGAPVAVARFVNALEPSTTYHYRLVAENSVDTTPGADQTFTTPAPAGEGEGEGLPDNRGYEMVSDPNKNGGDVLRTPQRTRVAVDGTAAGYGQFIASGDVVGTGLATDYISRRTGQPGTRGWATHATSPPQPALSIAKVLIGYDTAYQGFFSDDLSRGVVKASSPLTDDPDVAQAANLYLRDNLLEPGAGDYQLISECPVCAGTPIPATTAIAKVPEFIEATPDFGHILFESKLVLAAGALFNKANLYEWDHGSIKLAGTLPDGTPAKGSIAGGFRNPPGTLFAAPHLPEHSISDDGSKVFFTDLATKNLYMRVDGAQTVLISASEKTNGSGPGGTDPGGPQPAQYYDASQSGSRVFFVSKEALTDDAPVDSTSKLYTYDTTKPNSDPDNLTYLSVDDPASPDNSANVSGVIGADAAGQTVYFIDNGQLVAGEPPLVGRGVFAWHDGVVSFVSPLDSSDLVEMSRDQQNARQTQVAANGDLLLSLHASVGPTGYDQGNCAGSFGTCRELYLYRIASHALSCASCNPSGAPATADAVLIVGTGVGALSFAGAHEPHAITVDGSRAFFTTAEALVPGDRNGVNDAYEYDAASGRARLISSGTDPAPSYFMDATPSGDDAFFVTRERLVGWDGDQNYDLYDARVGGGFPEPVAVRECSGDACQGPAGGTPATPTAGSGIEGNGNPHPRRCARSQRRVHRHGKTICVKKHHKRNAKHDRRAGR